jgi:hypothetical protein
MEFASQYEQSYDSYNVDNATGKKKKKGKTKVGKLLTKAKKGAKKLGKAAGNLAKNVAGVSVLLPLQPLRPAMVAALKKKGVSVSKKTSLVDVANRFYTHVVKASGNYDHLPEIDTTEVTSDHFAVAIGVVVEGIISFFKAAKAKKDRGEKLSKTEEIAAQGTEVATQKIEESVKNEAAQEIGTRVLDNGKTWLLVGGAAIGLFLLLRK